MRTSLLKLKLSKKGGVKHGCSIFTPVDEPDLVPTEQFVGHGIVLVGRENELAAVVGVNVGEELHDLRHQHGIKAAVEFVDDEHSVKPFREKDIHEIGQSLGAVRLTPESKGKG